jgi:hypothetical protein
MHFIHSKTRSKKNQKPILFSPLHKISNALSCSQAQLQVWDSNAFPKHQKKNDQMALSLLTHTLTHSIKKMLEAMNHQIGLYIIWSQS